MTTIGESISRVRNILKGVTEDAFLTDRMIYHTILKYAKNLIKREDDKFKLMTMSGLYKPIPCVELIEVDKIEACCGGIKTGCKIVRTKDRIPAVFEGSFGPIFRTVSSLDGSVELIRTNPGTYTSITKTTTFKYNKYKYYWYLDGYLYMPNITWEGIRIEALFDGDINTFLCDSEDECTSRQEQTFNLPDYLFAEAEQFVEKEFSLMLQLPSDTGDDKNNKLR